MGSRVVVLGSDAGSGSGVAVSGSDTGSGSVVAVSGSDTGSGSGFAVSGSGSFESIDVEFSGVIISIWFGRVLVLVFLNSELKERRSSPSSWPFFCLMVLTEVIIPSFSACSMFL